MRTASQQDKSIKKIGWIISISLHIGVLLIALYTLIWTPPDPPIPEYGIEVNFGTSEVGSGDIQTPTPPAENNTPVENSSQETNPTPENTQPETQTIPPNEEESPIKAPKEEKKEAPKTEKNDAPKENANPKAIFTPNTGNPNEGGGKNQGNDVGKQGDKGDPKGDINNSAIYKGESSGKGGSSLNLKGWMWDAKPQVNDASSEEGKIVFKITVDDQGYIVGTIVQETTVSPALVKIYQREVQKITFSPLQGGTPPPTSNGTITFIIKSR